MLPEVLAILPRIAQFHSPVSSVYRILGDSVTKELRASSLMDPINGIVDLGDIGCVRFPYVAMGSVDSIHLFGLDELILFSYYWTNRDRYRRCADVGANLGLHSLIMEKCGFQVTAYEPDPNHVALMRRNLELNDVHSVEIVDSAVSASSGEREFVRVLGNWTGSHLVGAKDDPYGEVEVFQVKAISPRDVFDGHDLIKIDVEGEEAAIISTTQFQDWIGTDAIVEIGTGSNAKLVFDHLSDLGVNCFPQKIGWEKATGVGDMPESYHDGSLFISVESSMNWPAIC